MDDLVSLSVEIGVGGGVGGVAMENEVKVITGMASVCPYDHSSSYPKEVFSFPCFHPRDKQPAAREMSDDMSFQIALQILTGQ